MLLKAKCWCWVFTHLATLSFWHRKLWMALLGLCGCQESGQSKAKQSRVSCIRLSQTSWFLPDQGLSLSGHSQPESSLESVHETLTFCHFYLNPVLFAKPADQWLLSPALSLGQMSTVPACALSVLVFWFRPVCPLHRSLFTAEVFCQSKIAKS